MNEKQSVGTALEPASPQTLRDRLTALQWRKDALEKDRRQNRESLRRVEEFLAVHPATAQRQEELATAYFGDILKEIETNLTFALQDILGQDLKVVTSRDVKYGKGHIQFGIERGGMPEDILRGQGGSVCNVLSVGLRFIALSQLDEKDHRRFLVLDEQDCWLRPDLVPRLMGIVHTIAHKLGFQVLVISHHNIDLLREHADRIYMVKPAPGPEHAVTVERFDPPPPRSDRVLYNPAYTRMLGYEPEEFSGNLSEWLDRIHPDDRDRALEENLRCIDNEIRQFSVEFRMRTKAGTWKWILGRGMAVERDAAGKALRMIGAHTDITRIKEGERRETIHNWIAAVLSSMTHLDDRLALVFDAILNATGMECGGVYLLDPEENTLQLVHHRGLSESFVNAVRFYRADPSNLKLILSGQPLYTVYEDFPVFKKDAGKREGLRAIAVVPIHYEGRVVGCINTASRSYDETPSGNPKFPGIRGTLPGKPLGTHPSPTRPGRVYPAVCGAF